MATQRSAKPLPTFFMGKTEANTRVTNYMVRKHELLSGALGKMDTKSVWYSFTHIENLYKELVYLNADGLRIYMGTYEDTHPEFSGQLCLVMVPTRCDIYADNSVGHEDVLLEDETDFAERPGSEFFLDEPSKAFNYGAPCPTICPARNNEMKYPFTAS